MDTTSARLSSQTVLVIGGTRYLGAAIADRLRAEGATVSVTSSRGSAPGVLPLDLGDEAGIRAAAAELGPIDHVVSTASRVSDSPLADLDQAAARAALDAKVLGPLLLAKHLDIRRSMLLFSGAVGWRPSPRAVVKGVVNAAVPGVAVHLAAALAPVRVNAISPGIVDSGVWDAASADKSAFLAAAAARTPAGRLSSARDITDAVVFALASPSFNGETLHLEGGRW